MDERSKNTQKKSNSRRFNPVKGKLESLSECFEQLENGLPANQEAYVAGDRITHSYLKSCFLMIIQRAVDINNVIIEFTGQTPPQQKHQSFLTIYQNNAIDKKILDFFIEALAYYENIINPYQELAPSELYEIARDLLKHGKAYSNQIKDYFRTYASPPVARSDEV